MSSLRINNNISAINAHRNITNTDRAMGKTLNKLSSGLRINSAADGPASLVQSEAMRAQIGGINQAINNSEMGVALVQTADGALNEVNSLLVSVRQLAIHAANEGANDDAMLAADQQEIDNSLQTINRIANNTQFGTKRLLNGTQGANGIASGEHLSFISATTDTKTSPVGGYDVEVTQLASKAYYDSGVLSQEMIDNGEAINIMSDGKALTFRTNSDMNVNTVISNLNNELENIGINITAEKIAGNTGDRVKLSYNEAGSDHKFSVSSSSEGFFSKGEANLAMSSERGQDIAGYIGGTMAHGEGSYLKGAMGTSAEGLIVKYDGNLEPPVMAGEDGQEIANPNMGQHGQKVGTVTVAQNSLVFQIGANEEQTAKISIGDTSARSIGADVENVSGFRTLGDIDVTTFQGAQDAIAVVDKAIEDISTMRGDFGAFQKNTLESNISNLRIASENLTASESLLRDADMAATMADFTRNQIQGQAGMAMLAQANQLPNQVMSLIG